MGAIAFLLLFFLGLLLSTIGGITGIVDAFRVNTVWGLLALLVPFALLVYCIKFWSRKWARNSLIMSLSGLGLTLLAFPFLGGFITQQVLRLQPQDDFTVETIPADPDVAGELPAGEEPEAPTEEPDQAAAEATGDDELFKEAMLPGLPSAAQIALAELLPSTDPNERLKEIQRDRPDPYAFVPIPPPPQAAPPAPTTPPNPTAQPNNGNQPTGQAPNVTGGNGANGGRPGEPGGIEPLPELPNPTQLASQVAVSGIAQVNGEMYAIIRAPGEPTSRYVKEGDVLSNGAVLVKRIETRSGTTPVVVLEQRGIEVPLTVGANMNPPEEPTAAQPANNSPLAALPFLP
jgi:hypothetical protein